MLWIFYTAWAGDLDGLTGQSWGSTAGGPKDPAVIEASASQGGASGGPGAVIAGRPLASTEFLGKPATGTANYLEGQLAEVRFVVAAPYAEVLPLLEARMGPPLALGTGWVFGDGTTTVGVADADEATEIMLVSNQHRARCLELLGERCTLYASKAEMETYLASNPQLGTAVPSGTGKKPAPAPAPAPAPQPKTVAQIEVDRALLERNVAFIEAEVRTCLQASPLICAPAKAKLVDYWKAHPEIRPADDSGCKARDLPAKCWRW